MEDYGTAFPKWYITFQQAALAALPRPPQIDQDTALGWADNGEAMRRAFLQVLVPPTSVLAPMPRTRKKILSIDRTTPFSPAEFIGTGWSIWRGPADGDGLSGDEKQDERSLALKDINPAAILLETRLRDDEQEMTGEERILRLKVADRIRLDAAILQVFWKNKPLIPVHFKKKIRGRVAYIFFDGTVLRSPHGRRWTLCLYFGPGEWRWHFSWLSHGRGVLNPSAVLASI